MEHEGMVHALNEAYRVLKDNSHFIDLRPVSSHPPIEILTAAGAVSAGNLDETQGEPGDLASDEAVAAVVQAGKFDQTCIESFEIATYWESLAGLTEYATERWAPTAIIPADALHRAEEIVKDEDKEPRIRIMRDLHLAVYRKKSP